VSILLGNGDGTFQALSTFASGNAPISIVVGDFNADGIADLATADTNDADVSVMLGNGDGTFQTRMTFAVGSTPQNLVAADLNRDGVMDLAVVNTDCFEDLFSSQNGMGSGPVDVESGNRNASAMGGCLGGERAGVRRQSMQGAGNKRKKGLSCLYVCMPVICRRA